MSETLPLFPLGTVLYPGLLLPLNIFEERYRRLVRDLLEGPEPKRFGVIAIRKGRETGVDGISALHEIGCTATLREVAEQEDGGFHLVTVGTQRFRLESLDDSQPYFQGEVELLEEEVGDEAAAGLAAQAVQRGFRGYVEAVNNPEDESAGKRKVPFSKVLYIEQDDFREDPPKQYYRLSPGREVRLRYGYFITAKTVVKNDRGEAVEVHCTYDPATRGGNAPDGRKVKSTIHWVSAAHALDAEVRIYDKLFTKEDPNQVE